MSNPSRPEWPVPVSIAPDILAEIQAEFAREWLLMTESLQQGNLAPPADRRFGSKAWAASPASLLAAHTYLLSAKAMSQMVDALQVSEPVRNRLRFSTMQWIEAVAPSNFMASNPDVQQALLESEGQSLRKGLDNLFKDLQKGRLSQTDESKFELGKNVATTAGSVVYQNQVMQLIQYAPVTDKVHKIPLLLVPPSINKYYILDLQPENSFVRHAVEQGFTVFLVSWRNPLASDIDGIDQATWADYLQHGVLQAIDAVCSISRQKQINALGFCVGGTLLASALSLAHAQGKDPVCSLTLLTTLLDFEETGVLDVFVDEYQVQAREHQLGTGGLMSARELATTFSFLRPNELVWNYVVANYLKGESPPAFDLLHWNADGTNLPGPFFAWYFRNTYLENNLKVPGRVQVDGYQLDLSTLSMPAYIYSSREDHIVPWHSAYASNNILRGPIRFILGASGHIAGVINPPAKKRRCYWAQEASAGHDEMPGNPESWLANADEHAGSWWPDWCNWLVAHSGSLVRAPAKPGNARYTPIEDAPGSYVKQRAQ
ncbi:PHA/PHB synthase family protein [Pollutimonas harenae]|uniref:Class I poly(R)-hydroxyalkanoic acid synthase n=1 Tax=Pollutimonas harenae TaxID=657015 RepID=A0A853H5X1_9BURK|nr:class I poly(R)-hydroxyalkanoic acid synthase [Pollutimonas harenae]NYT86565.1 class I poly(R)-hydroxyalkanoic acid synthase [Pollutimonas harenae]TEA69694.1 class I poly(R)-hydroxyalkanoic acid synthase [Pollutimonas harenae]